MRKWSMLDSGEITPRGWLRRQLEIQSDSLSGHLDFIWNDVKNSAWLGGNAEGWERLPYWLDGFIPMAYLLGDEKKKARAKHYIDEIISRRRRDGWICPVGTSGEAKYDTWALLLMMKVLTVYYRLSSDERIPGVIYDAMKNYYDLLSSGKISLFSWGKARWFEGFISLNLLWQIYGEEWVRDLGAILRAEGTKYEDFTEEWKLPLRHWRFETHIVNIAMMLKSEAVSCDLLGEQYGDLASRLWDVLSAHNGTAVGTLTGDEVLAGLSPSQGTELCSVVELMYSLEHLYAYTGDAKWAELLEKVTFNALPATFTDDMWTHQYDQLVNQIACETFPGRPHYMTNACDANIFGFDPEYGCCTANFSQGWPKLAMSTFMRSESTIICALALPSAVKCDLCEIELSTDYPFENTFEYDVNAKKDFEFVIRVPSFALDLTVDGAATDPSGELRFKFSAGERRKIKVSMRSETRVVSRGGDMVAVECGSIVYSLPIERKTKRIERERNGLFQKFPYCTYEFSPTSEWRYGICSVASEPMRSGTLEIPFSSVDVPLRLSAKVRRVEWGYEYGCKNVSAARPECSDAFGEEIDVDLVPYGATILRITEIPKVKSKA